MSKEATPLPAKPFDKIGILLSSACMIHCIATPLLLLALPSLSLSLFGQSFHQVLAIVLPVIALVAFIPGYRHHKDRSVIFFGLLGVLIISASAFYPWEESVSIRESLITVAGSLTLIAAHLRNRKLCQCHL